MDSSATDPPASNQGYSSALSSSPATPPPLNSDIKNPTLLEPQPSSIALTSTPSQQACPLLFTLQSFQIQPLPFIYSNTYPASTCLGYMSLQFQQQSQLLLQPQPYVYKPTCLWPTFTTHWIQWPQSPSQYLPLSPPWAPLYSGPPVMLSNGNVVYQSPIQQYQPWMQPGGLVRRGPDVKPGRGGLIPHWNQNGQCLGLRPA